MEKNLLFTRHKLNRYVKSFLDVSKISFNVLTEYNFSYKDQYLYGPRIQKYYKDRYSIKELTFSTKEIDEIISRCRLLRSIEYEKAIKFIAAAEIVSNEIVYDYGCRFLLAPRIDTYFLDILDRKLSNANRTYLGVWRSAFKRNNFFLTKRGELKHISDTNDQEVTKLIKDVGNLEFRATSLSNSNFSYHNFIIKHLKRYGRDVALESIRLASRFNKGYRELTTGIRVEDYNIPIMSWRGDFSDDEVIRKVLKSSEKKVFIALQVNPEATIDYYVKNLEFIDIDKTLLFITRVYLAKGFQVIIKDHPNMFGKRNFSTINLLTKYENVYLANYTLSSNEIIASSDLVFTWSGTVAVQAYFNSIPSLSICSPYSLEIPGMYVAYSFSDLEQKVQTICEEMGSDFFIDSYKEDLARNILKSHSVGEIFTVDSINPNPNDFANWVDTNYSQLTSL